MDKTKDTAVKRFGEREEELPCGCTGVAARGRKLCPYAKALKERLDERMDEEKLARRTHGSASPEREKAMGARLEAQHLFFGHLSGKAAA